MSDQIKFYGSVSDRLLKKALIKGTLIGLTGLLVMPFSFILGAILLAWGFWPYQKLKSLSPLLIVTERSLISGDDSIPINQIQQIRYEKETIIVEAVEKTIRIPHFSKRTFDEVIHLIESDHAS